MTVVCIFDFADLFAFTAFEAFAALNVGNDCSPLTLATFPGDRLMAFCLGGSATVELINRKTRENMCMMFIIARKVSWVGKSAINFM